MALDLLDLRSNSSSLFSTTLYTNVGLIGSSAPLLSALLLGLIFLSAMLLFSKGLLFLENGSSSFGSTGGTYY